MTKSQFECAPVQEFASRADGNGDGKSASLFERAIAQEWLMEGSTASGDEVHQVYINATPFRVGRRSSNHLTISNRTVSGRHAELIADSGELRLRDHHSTNGTFLNGKRVNSIVTVEDGDVIHFGKVRFHVRRNRDSMPRATLAFDAEGDAMAHLQFASLWDADGEALTPYFQPILRFADKKIVGFESLARSELSGLENPYAMFQIAKQHDAESELSTLLRQVSLRLARPIFGEYAIYLNTHPREMGDTKFLSSLEELRGEFPKASIVVEVHESGTASIPFLQDLKSQLIDLDMKLAYDDFGQGQSRLNALAEVTPDIVKFDMELVRGLHKSTATRRRFVRSLLKIVKALNGTTLAEGVEEADEATACEDLGFELVQGYYFGRPAPIKQCLANLDPLAKTYKVQDFAR